MWKDKRDYLHNVEGYCTCCTEDTIPSQREQSSRTNYVIHKNRYLKTESHSLMSF